MTDFKKILQDDILNAAQGLFPKDSFTDWDKIIKDKDTVISALKIEIEELQESILNAAEIIEKRNCEIRELRKARG